MENTKNRFKRGAVSIAIAVLTVLFIALLVDAFFEEPKWEDYCKKYSDIPPPVKMPVNSEKTQCPEPNQELIDACYKEGGFPVWNWTSEGCQVYKECNMCQKNMENARKYVHRYAFYLGATLSLIALIIGIFWPIEFIGTGFMFGGIIGLFYSTVRYFSDMDKFLRVGVIFIELLIVLGITYLKLVGKEGFGRKRPRRTMITTRIRPEKKKRRSRR